MKDHEILVGKIYSDGLGSTRKVLSIGSPAAGVKVRQSEDSSSLLYRILSGNRLRGAQAGDERSTTVHSFARWAKDVVTGS